MKFAFLAHAFLLFTSTTSTMVTAQGNDIDLSPLGTPSLDIYTFTSDVIVDANDMFTLTMTMEHPSLDLPVGTAETCVPLQVAEQDGKDYLASRWYWDNFDTVIQQVTAFAHVSIDYNACGHPPEGYMQAHYDFHLYYVTPEFRITNMVCPVRSDAPICDPAISSNPFFQVARAIQEEEEEGAGNSTSITETMSQENNNNFINIPPGYEIDLFSAVPHMGLHLLDPQETPATRDDWIDPVLAFCTFDNQVVAFEPMFPFHFNSGTQDHDYVRTDIEVVVSTIPTLPTAYEVHYNAATDVTTVIVQGKSALTQQEWKALTQNSNNDNVNEDNQQQDSTSSDANNDNNDANMPADAAIMTTTTTTLAGLLVLLVGTAHLVDH